MASANPPAHSYPSARRRVLSVRNARLENFSSEDAFNDYLEHNEDLILKLNEGGQDALEAERFLEREAAAHADAIAERAARDAEEKRVANVSHAHKGGAPIVEQHSEQRRESSASASPQQQQRSETGMAHEQAPQESEQQRKLNILLAGGYHPEMAKHRAVSEALSSLGDSVLLQQHQEQQRYWRSGCCAKGDACPFGHGHGAVPDNTCRYFLRGQCAYGDRCRYSHVRPSSNARPRPQAQPVLSGRDLVPQPAASSPPANAPSRTAGPYAAAASTLLGVGLPHEQEQEQEQEHPLMETNGSCSDPFAPEHQSDEWLEKKRVETERIQRSAGLECGICLEEVLSKPYLSDRRFAVMSHCEHIFCWRCMKDWRYGHGQMGGASSSAAEQARRCPECQQLSYFIAPCSFFPEGSEERAKVFEERRKQLSRIPCKHFDFGRGHCPFESSCFYAHIFPDGTREDGSRRKAGDAEGNIRVVQPVRLSSFLEASKHTAQN